MALMLLDEFLDTSYPFNRLQRPSVPFSSRQNSDSAELQRQNSDCGVSIQNTKEGFKANLDVQQFRPEELLVRMIDDYVVVEGKHEERQDSHGYISRQFQRRYKLPKDIESDSVTSTLSSDGVLTISAPKKQPVPLPDVDERIVPITETREPAIKQYGQKQQLPQAQE